MSSFSVAGKSVATAATANNAGAALWNPHATRPLFVTAISYFKTIATADELALGLISARGTQTLTVTSTSQSDVDGDTAAVTGATLDLTYSVQPTFVGAAVPKFRWAGPATVAAGFFLPFPRPWMVKAGQGLCFYTIAATILQPAMITVFWDE